MWNETKKKPSFKNEYQATKKGMMNYYAISVLQAHKVKKKGWFLFSFRISQWLIFTDVNNFYSTGYRFLEFSLPIEKNG